MNPEEGFEVKTSRTLISSAMLTAMCDTNSIDNLKLLEKFVAMCVAELTDVGSVIDKNSPELKADEDAVSVWLGDFFDARGVDVLFDIDELRVDTIKNSDVLNYQIGRFILDAKENNDILFAKIENIARGAMIASAIYIDTSNTPAFVKERRLTNLSVYLDTAFVLSALNYKRADQKNAADISFYNATVCVMRLLNLVSHYSLQQIIIWFARQINSCDIAHIKCRLVLLFLTLT